MDFRLQTSGAQRWLASPDSYNAVVILIATDEDARQAQPGPEPDLRFGRDMWAVASCCTPWWAGILSFTTQPDSNRRSPSDPCTRDGARATSPSSGMSSTTWTRRPGSGRREIGNWPPRCPATGSTSRRSRGDPKGLVGPSVVACVRRNREQGPISSRSDERRRRSEYQWPDRLRLRVFDGARQALCRAVNLSFGNGHRRTAGRRPWHPTSAQWGFLRLACGDAARYDQLSFRNGEGRRNYITKLLPVLLLATPGLKDLVCRGGATTEPLILTMSGSPTGAVSCD